MAAPPQKTTRSKPKGRTGARSPKGSRSKAASAPRSAARGAKSRRSPRRKGGGGFNTIAFVITLVGFIVLAGGAALWVAMEWPRGPERIPAARIDPPKRRALSEEERTNAVIRRALQDMAGMPFEEALVSPVEEGVKQVDFALAQAMVRRNLPLDAMNVDKAELRTAAGGEYHFQRIHIAVADDAAGFAAALRDALRTLADRAELAKRSAAPDTVLTVRVKGVLTHELVLGAAPPSQGTGAKEGPGRVLRRRAPGTPARLVIVMDDLGQSMPAVRSLIALPYRVTFAVWPYASHAKEAAIAAHKAGREVIVHQPMEPMGYPDVKPGPGVVLTGDPDNAIAERIRESLGRVPYAVGLNNHMGSRFTRDARATGAVLGVLRERKLFALDSLTHAGSVFYAQAARYKVPHLRRDVFLDVEANRSAILRQLRRAEEVALVTGQAIAIGHPLPETLAALKEWRPSAPDQVRIVTLADLLR